ncbi:MAG: hypothetical protein R3E01_23540 [Pirellulaceae bacterium]|nr:hypothetical protein [Planctomycetales bacterium]
MTQNCTQVINDHMRRLRRLRITLIAGVTFNLFWIGWWVPARARVERERSRILAEETVRVCREARQNAMGVGQSDANEGASSSADDELSANLPLPKDRGWDIKSPDTALLWSKLFMEPAQLARISDDELFSFPDNRNYQYTYRTEGRMAIADQLELASRSDDHFRDVPYVSLRLMNWLCSPHGSWKATSQAWRQAAESISIEVASRASVHDIDVESEDVTIRNDELSPVAVSFLLDGEIVTLQPGESRIVPAGSDYVVRFDRGDDFGPALESVSAGEHVFAVDEHGWRLEARER